MGVELAVSERFTLLKARQRDAGALAPLFDAYRRFYGRPSDPAAGRRFLLRRSARKESVVFLARSGRAVLGFTQLYPTFSSLTLKRVWILNDLYVVPEGRRRGVAAALMTRALRLARETGAEGLFLETAVGNKAARRLYEKLGWKREREFYRYNFDL